MIRRGTALVDSLDLYDYLLQRAATRPTSGSRPATWSSCRCTADSPPVAGKVLAAGDLRAASRRDAARRHRVRRRLRSLRRRRRGSPSIGFCRRSRAAPGGRARVVIAVGADQFSGGVAPAVPMAPGDSVTVHPVADRQRGYVTVRGNVWVEGEVGFTPGMKLSDAIRLAGGPKPDVYLDRILVTRMREDSSFIQLRSAFADSTGRAARGPDAAGRGRGPRSSRGPRSGSRSTSPSSARCAGRAACPTARG